MDKRERKEIIREELRKNRRDISDANFREWSDKIISKLKDQREYKTARIIHAYVSMNDRREVNTHSLILEILNEQKKMVVPVTQFKAGNLRHFYLESYNELKPNKWGVLEPEGGEECPIEKIELVIVPMVGGDEQGYRIGYGGGFYDRFLEDITCPKIGLCFEQNMVDELPIEPFDIALDKIITEKRIIRR
ncbi:5-formyltetrahydrofolate cyclo-ligase [Aliifodinibius salicampi]|uniref:5-formyltetrahydrofolate cyclo-ligase n=1 Tax=Fodinibius salicampi TaxID=1920655 RepID=A0ABT3PW59_9BACT|nr:5-formyltetrahydrofolate cyclo-ligase [Fodinibius salicampi]MCW9712094.1 5-formyltetrahydrofolate cyclo-ligase [Fodinibius salicampi]